VRDIVDAYIFVSVCIGAERLSLMFINFSYCELCELKACLAHIETVYANGKTVNLQNKIDEILHFMDTAPISQVYDVNVEGVGTVIT